MKKSLYITLGSISLALGIIGVFLPVLPTTPFLLLTAALYARSSDTLYEKLMHHRIVGIYIRSFREEKAIPLHGKIISLASMWMVILYTSLVVLSGKWYLQVLLFAIAGAVSWHILSFKTKKREK